MVVVGAGIGGLCAAKTFLELAPETRLLVLEAVSYFRPFLSVTIH